MNLANSVAARAPTLQRLSSVLFVLSAVSVAVLSVLPQQDLPAVHLWDKLEHFLAYVGVASLGGVAFPERRSQAKLGFGLVALGCFLEIVQGFVPGRESSALDAFANALGVGVGLSLAWIFNWVQTRCRASTANKIR